MAWDRQNSGRDGMGMTTTKDHAWPVALGRISRYDTERLRGFLGATAMLVSEPDTRVEGSA